MSTLLACDRNLHLQCRMVRQTDSRRADAIPSPDKLRLPSILCTCHIRPTRVASRAFRPSLPIPHWWPDLRPGRRSGAPACRTLVTRTPRASRVGPEPRRLRRRGRTAPAPRRDAGSRAADHYPSRGRKSESGRNSESALARGAEPAAAGPKTGGDFVGPGLGREDAARDRANAHDDRAGRGAGAEPDQGLAPIARNHAAADCRRAAPARRPLSAPASNWPAVCVHPARGIAVGRAIDQL